MSGSKQRNDFVEDGVREKTETKSVQLEIYDPTLRDGSHAVKHCLSLRDIATYCAAIDKCGLSAVEVGHGNGLGASSLQLGFAAHSDAQMLECARENLSITKLGVHAIPGFAKIGDLKLAIDIGVDVVRVASHCTEADTTERYIEYARNRGAVVHGVLMMSHMASALKLLEQATLQQEYGAHAIVLMDSAGAYVEADVQEKIGLLASELSIPVGFHAHNNLGLAVANSLAAVRCGAKLIDGTLNGFGAGAGNTSLQVLVAALSRVGHETDVDMFALLKASDRIVRDVELSPPVIKQANILSGLFGVFSGFEKPVARASLQFGVDEGSIYRELERRKVVAGQEDLIVEVAQELSKTEHRAVRLRATEPAKEATS
ncbi:4-hydroxy-2-oxovalerate aldolase [Trinickia fusca]|uniref:4-hydroxy-2-oxovalerate aldolase n=1 Tax=Trinickia fusca TaxID=2419777 RepID=A0A494XF85_9BURK|nr:4-hydroxy-2-oxovalerate aldolase [Trinickia fusca]RKP49310.1 4-hydroxy-2-oxovalerate aldolase [Trinickia fusca]